MMQTPADDAVPASAAVRWALRIVLVLSVATAIAFGALWRSEVRAREQLTRDRELERQKVRDLCGTVLSQFRWVAKAMTSGKEHGMPERAASVTRVGWTSQLLVGLADTCAPTRDQDAPILNLGLAINDVETLDLQWASRHIEEWATWYVRALEAGERDGWVK